MLTTAQIEEAKRRLRLTVEGLLEAPKKVTFPEGMAAAFEVAVARDTEAFAHACEALSVYVRVAELLALREPTNAIIFPSELRRALEGTK